MTDGLTGPSNGKDLGVGGRVCIVLAAIVPAPDDFASRFVDDDAADRHFISRLRKLRLGDRLEHRFLMGHRIRVEE